jgi:hypothetical protein
MKKIELGRHSAAIEQCRECHAAGATVHSGQLPECGGVRMDDSPRQRLLRSRMRRPKRSHDQAEESGADGNRLRELSASGSSHPRSFQVDWRNDITDTPLRTVRVMLSES